MSKKINIAIDGPSGVGKSSIAKYISKELNLVFVNTGLMYRAIGFYCLRNNINLDNEQDVESHLNKIKLNMLPNEQIELNNQNITLNLWEDKISLAASKIAKYSSIRNFCVIQQQKIAIENPGVVMEGRDIASVVLPNAELKVFLTASSEIRAKRRVTQLLEKGEEVSYEKVLENVVERDKQDRERTNAPLIKTKDAIEIDTSNLSLQQVIDKILELAKERM